VAIPVADPLDLRSACATHGGLADQSAQATDPGLCASARTYPLAAHDPRAGAAPLHPKGADALAGDGTLVGWVVGIAARGAWPQAREPGR
jgi:hypothetical protein